MTMENQHTDNLADTLKPPLLSLKSFWYQNNLIVTDIIAYLLLIGSIERPLNVNKKFYCIV